MPTVPTYDEPLVRQAAIPGVRAPVDAPIEAFGGGQAAQNLFQASGVVAREASELAIQEKQKADDLVTAEAFTKTVQKRNELFWDPKSGAMAKRGKDAFGVVTEYGKAFDTFADEIEKGFANEDQRQMYRKMRLREKAEFDAQLHQHLFRESKEFEKTTIEAGLATQREDAVLNYQAPGFDGQPFGKVRESIRMQETFIMKQAADNGLPADWVKLKVQEAASKTHMGVLDRMLANGQDQAAKEYYEKFRDGFSGADVANVEKALEVSSIRGESQRQSDTLWDKARGDLKTALEQATKISDPKVREETEQRIRQKAHDDDAARRQRQEQTYLAVSNIIERTKGKERGSELQWMTLSPEERKAAEARQQQLLEGKQPVTNWGRYYDLKQIASNATTREEFLRLNLLTERSSMADTEFKELVNLQAALRRGDEDVAKKLDGYRTKSQIVDGALSSIGIDPTPSTHGGDESQKVQRFRRMVDEEIQLTQKRTGKELTNEEVQGIVDRLLVEGVKKRGWIWDDKARVFEVEPGESLEIGVKDIPDAQRRTIETVLRERKIPVTDENIIRYFNLRVSRGRK
jgi:hypothetical protein